MQQSVFPKPLAEKDSTNVLSVIFQVLYVLNVLIQPLSLMEKDVFLLLVLPTVQDVLLAKIFKCARHVKLLLTS